jgi:Asp-tRNA(Asn)/Glu-tRNA(Gln) amidotransferase A subunit family amidase
MYEEEYTHPMDLTMIELIERIHVRRSLTPLEAVQKCLERIRERNPSIGAIVYVCGGRAIEKARRQTRLMRENKPVGPLAGVPFVVKDLEDVEGLPTSYGCVAFENNIATASSPQVRRLQHAGAIVVGKANTALFGGNAGCRNALMTTKNPWNLSKTSGGSSGGSAAAVAARMVPVATAADGGGSIRIPAAFTGCFGIKPTCGFVPQTEGRSFEMLPFLRCVHFGPISRSVRDAAMYLDIVGGYDPEDPMSLPKRTGTPLLKLCLEEHIKPLRLGFCPLLGNSRDVAEPEALFFARNAFRRLMRIVDSCSSSSNKHHQEDMNVDIPDIGLSWLKLMGTQERLTIKKKVLEMEKRTNTKVNRGMMKTWNLLEETFEASDLEDAHRILFEINEIMTKTFREIDILVTLAMPIEPFSSSTSSLPFTLSDGTTTFDSPWSPVFSMIPFNFSGHPCCVCRSGISKRTGTPWAIQLVAPRHRDDLLLQVASMYERETGMFDAWPDFSSSNSSSSSSSSSSTSSKL